MSQSAEIISRSVADGAVGFLNDQCWHDSILHEIRLIRAHSADQVVLELDLIDDWEVGQLSAVPSSRRVQMTFSRCWLVQAQMNWGVICLSDGEMIYGAECKETGALLDQVRATWKGIEVDVSNLAEFSLELASTSSTLSLVFGTVTLEYQRSADQPVNKHSGR